MKLRPWHTIVVLALGFVCACAALLLKHFESDLRGTVSLSAGDAVEIGNETLVLRKFTVEKYPSGRPRQYVSDVSIISSGSDDSALPTADNASISVNHPFVRGDSWIYQSSYNAITGETVIEVVRDPYLPLAVVAGVLLLVGAMLNLLACGFTDPVVSSDLRNHSRMRHVVTVLAALVTLAVPMFIILRAVLRAEPVPALQSPLMAPHVAAYATSYIIMLFAAFGICRRFLPLGFLLMTLGLILGAVWGKICWGDWWQYDPKEMWGFYTWLVYAVYFTVRSHPRLEFAFRLAGAVMVILTATWVNFAVRFSGLHSYAS